MALKLIKKDTFKEPHMEDEDDPGEELNVANILKAAVGDPDDEDETEEEEEENTMSLLDDIMDEEDPLMEAIASLSGKVDDILEKLSHLTDKVESGEERIDKFEGLLAGIGESLAKQVVYLQTVQTGTPIKEEKKFEPKKEEPKAEEKPPAKENKKYEIAKKELAAYVSKMKSKKRLTNDLVGKLAKPLEITEEEVLDILSEVGEVTGTRAKWLSKKGE